MRRILKLLILGTGITVLYSSPTVLASVDSQVTAAPGNASLSEAALVRELVVALQNMAPPIALWDDVAKKMIANMSKTHPDLDVPSKQMPHLKAEAISWHNLKKLFLQSKVPMVLAHLKAQGVPEKYLTDKAARRMIDTALDKLYIADKASVAVPINEGDLNAALMQEMTVAIERVKKLEPPAPAAHEELPPLPPAHEGPLQPLPDHLPPELQPPVHQAPEAHQPVEGAVPPPPPPPPAIEGGRMAPSLQEQIRQGKQLRKVEPQEQAKKEVPRKLDPQAALIDAIKKRRQAIHQEEEEPQAPQRKALPEKATEPTGPAVVSQPLAGAGSAEVPPPPPPPPPPGEVSEKVLKKAPLTLAEQIKRNKEAKEKAQTAEQAKGKAPSQGDLMRSLEEKIKQKQEQSNPAEDTPDSGKEWE